MKSDEKKGNTSENKDNNKYHNIEDDEASVFLLNQNENKKILQNKQKYINQIFNRLNFTRYHFYLILSIFLMRTIDGTELLNLSLTSEMIENSFKLAEHSSSHINVIILSGNLAGSLLSMYISNKRPRKFIINIGLIFILIFGLFSILTHQINLFILCRFLVNIGISLVIVASSSLVVESINPKYRGFIINIILVSSSAGEIFITSFLNNLIDLENPHDWRKIFLLALAPVFIGAIFVPFYPDSILYYIDKKEYLEAYKVCKIYFVTFNESEENFIKIMKGEGVLHIENNGQNKLEIINKDNLILKNDVIEIENNVTTNNHNSSNINISSSVLSIKSKENIFFEYVIIMIFALFNAFLGQGVRYILPKTLTHVYHLKNFSLHEDNLKENYKHNVTVVSLELQLSSIGSGLLSFISGIVIDNTYLKRVKLLRIGIFISTIIAVLAYVIKSHIDVFACVLKSVINLQDLIIDVYSVEVFETKRRVMLLSIYNIIQSSSAFVSPYFNDILTNYWFRSNYLVFSILLFICFLLSLLLGREKIKNILS